MGTEQNDGESVEIGVAGGGQSLKARGVNGVLIVGLLALLIFLGYLFYDMSKQNFSKDLDGVSALHGLERDKVNAQQTAEHRAIIDVAREIRADHQELGSELNKINKSIAVQNYIILADEAERQRIKKKLHTPDELK